MAAEDLLAQVDQLTRERDQALGLLARVSDDACEWGHAESCPRAEVREHEECDCGLNAFKAGAYLHAPAGTAYHLGPAAAPPPPTVDAERFKRTWDEVLELRTGRDKLAAFVTELWHDAYGWADVCALSLAQEVSEAFGVPFHLEHGPHEPCPDECPAHFPF